MYGLIFCVLAVLTSGGTASPTGITLPTIPTDIIPTTLIPTTPITLIPSIPSSILTVITNKIPVGISIPTTLPTSIFPTSFNLPTNVFPTAIFTSLTWPTNLIPTKTVPTTLFPFNLFPTNFFPSNLLPTNLFPTNLFPTKTVTATPLNLIPTIPTDLVTTKTINLNPANILPTSVLPSNLFTTKTINLNAANLLPSLPPIPTIPTSLITTKTVNLNPANLFPSLPSLPALPSLPPLPSLPTIPSSLFTTKTINLNPANILPSLPAIPTLPSSLFTTKTISINPANLLPTLPTIPSNILPTKTINLNPASILAANSVSPVSGFPPNVFPSNLFTDISNFPSNILQDIGNIQQGAQNFLNSLPLPSAATAALRSIVPPEVAHCGGSTTKDTVWENEAYPKIEGGLPGICTLKLTPPAGTCALRVNFDDLVLLPAFSFLSLFNPYSCNQDAPFFKMTYNGATTRAFCADLSKYEGIAKLDPDHLEPVIFLLQLDPSNAIKFRVNITNVPCSSIETYKSPTICGIKNDRKLASGRSDFSHLNLDEDFDFGYDEMPSAPVRRSVGKPSSRQTQSTKKKLMAANLKKKPDIFSQALALGLENGKVKLSLSNPRIIGQEAGIGEWPWMVAIQRRVEIGTAPIPSTAQLGTCSGVLLNQQHVLTSASCMMPIVPMTFVKVSGIRTMLAEHNISSSSETLTFNSSVSRVIFPLSFNPILLKHDLAVLKLSQPVDYQQNIRPVCLPVNYNVFRTADGVVSGWDGTLSQPSAILKSTDVKISNATYCNQTINDFLTTLPTYFGISTSSVNNNDYVCADKGILGSPVCYEDLGIPLIRRDQTGAYFLEGMSTTFSSCGTAVPNIFSRIWANSTFLNLALA